MRPRCRTVACSIGIISFHATPPQFMACGACLKYYDNEEHDEDGINSLRTPRYCSRRCQQLHWAKHKATCIATQQRQAKSSSKKAAGRKKSL